ncbi:hypothetical protein EBB07_18505 [Paenibacillaceae bacterium]|nr:hypothetical protein EBB07_18505 [Paenibacillaceae bacterium]
MGTAQRIHDYKLEELLRCPYKFHKEEARRAAGKFDPNWRQLVQYSVGYIINDYYSLPAQLRNSTALLRIAERRWTNRIGRFGSLERFAQVKGQALANLTRHLDMAQSGLEPLMLFESHDAYIPELGLNLSMILQAVFSLGNTGELAAGGEPPGYIVRKYLVAADQEIVDAFCHMTAVFCKHAFSQLPQRIEVYGIMEDVLYSIAPDEASLAQSVDYVRLLTGFMPEAGNMRKDRAAAECGGCPYKNDCF